MKLTKQVLLFIAAALLFAACGTTSTVPITGRKHRISVSDEQVLSLSKQEYDKYMQTAKKSTNAANTAMVERVGRRLANAVETYLKNNGYADEVKNYSWEFNLVQNSAANAFCMPGGKIVVYDGLLPYTKDEASLAIVLGHEIAHAVAKHSAEQLSKQQNQQVAGQVLSGVLGAVGASSEVSQMAQVGFGLGTQLGNLHYSRENESEADYMGLIFAAMAGYNPNAAVTFWERMAQASQNNGPAFLSDHPSDASRIAAIKKELPEAMKYYNAAVAAGKKASVNTTTKSKKSTRTVHVSSRGKSSKKR